MTAVWTSPVLATYPAGADLSALQWSFVKLNAAGQAVPITAITDVAVGVLQNAPSAVGRAAEVCIVGGTKLRATAAIALPAILGTDAVGRAKKLTPGTDTTQYVFGVADGDQGIAAAAGDIISAVINTATPARAA